MNKYELAKKITQLEGLTNEEKASLVELLRSQKKYGLVWEDKPEEIVYDDRNVEVFNFGKHKGKSVEEVFRRLDTGYYAWMMQGDFPQNTKNVITNIKLRCK